MSDKSFKPENLHPLAGLAIPTMLAVMSKKVDEKLKLFYLFQATERRVRGIQAGISFCLGAVCVSPGAILPRVTVLAELAILIVALYITSSTIIGLKWCMYDEAKAFHEASSKIFEEFYGEAYQQ